MEAKKSFEPAALQVILFEKNDVITTSDQTPPIEKTTVVNTGFEQAF